MFPYRIRKPAWGSLKPRSDKKNGRTKATRSSNNVNNGNNNNSGDATATSSTQHHDRLDIADDDDPRRIGGNLQRAILSDLVALRRRYREVEAEAAASTTTTAAKKTTDTTRRKITTHCAPLGASFSNFKTCFRTSRFGALHTRAMPPRVDRGEYVQLLYSCCFYLLGGSFAERRGRYRRGMNDDGEEEPLSWEEVEDEDDDDGAAMNGTAFDAIYALFVLYALHETNVLPRAPPPPSHEPNARKRTRGGSNPIANGKSSPHATNLHKSRSSSEASSKAEAWSMLPVGINGEDDKLRRRQFRAPVRADRHGYLMLLRLRDACRVRMDDCAARMTTTMMETTNTMCAGKDDNDVDPNDDASSSWRCRCGLARDAAHVVDRMLLPDDKNGDDPPFFEYCEYHGPHCLEGLAGNPNFYRSHFDDDDERRQYNRGGERRSRRKRTTKTTAVTTVSSSSPAIAPMLLTAEELDAMGRRKDDDADVVRDDSSSDSEQQHTRLSDIVERHRSNLSTVATELCKSRRLPSAGVAGVVGIDDDDNHRLQPRQRELVEGTLGGVLKRHDDDYDDYYHHGEFMYKRRRGSIPEDDDAKEDDAKSPPHGRDEIDRRHTKRGMLLKFPKTFSSSLRDGIAGALSDFDEQAVGAMIHVAREEGR
eukprot:CAMPEP_0181126906 /NCGR_PEP_ID=MMETSP1071-20121207/27897_1 /TAXON_ID=35127 /ORGANISM="Thalassiosira sp., Strain NH16" /LENGTH=649 /DNA_ID=CAMNT_0023212575 /DNA_START=294 /DNA_END=2239 /DNA_ORIENTATION=+